VKMCVVNDTTLRRCETAVMRWHYCDEHFVNKILIALKDKL